MQFDPIQYVKVLAGTLAGLLLIWIGVTGRLGSLLGAIITPDFMVDGQEKLGNNSQAHAAPLTPVVKGGVANIDQIGQFAYIAGIQTQNPLAIAIAIAQAESGGNVTAYNGGNPPGAESSCGLWQVNLLAHPQYTKAQMFDPQQNAKAMYAISNSGTNWNPWSTFTNGAYKTHMNDANVAALALITGNQGAHKV